MGQLLLAPFKRVAGPPNGLSCGFCWQACCAGFLLYWRKIPPPAVPCLLEPETAL